MAARPRQFADFRVALKTAYEEEISGAAFFAALGEAFGGRAAEALNLFAEIEEATEAAIAPLAERYGLPETPREALCAEGRAEAQGLVHLGWHGFLDNVIEDYPAFIDEFADLRRRVSGPEAETLQVLVDHEQALLDFARAERAGDDESFAVLRNFLTRVSARA